MAPLPVIANTYRCALKYLESVSNQIAVNVIHLRSSGTDAVAIAALLDLAAPLGWGSWMPPNAGVNTIQVTPLDGSSATFNRVTTNAHWGGTSTGDWVPNASPIVQFATTLRGRSHRGRAYLPFPTEAVLSDGTLGVSEAGVIQSSWAQLGANIDSAGAEHVVASYVLATAQPIAGYSVMPAVGTQRRRQTRIRYP